MLAVCVLYCAIWEISGKQSWIGNRFKTALLYLSLKWTTLGWRESFDAILYGLISEAALGVFSLVRKKGLSPDEAKLINIIILNLKTTGYP